MKFVNLQRFHLNYSLLELVFLIRGILGINATARVTIIAIKWKSKPKAMPMAPDTQRLRSEERRVGKEC